MGSTTEHEPIRDPLLDLLNEIEAQARQRFASRAAYGRRLAESEMAGRERAMSEDPADQSARESVYTAAMFYVAAAISGFDGGKDAWRSADLQLLIDHIGQQLRQGLDPHLDIQAVMDGAVAAKAMLVIEP